MARQLSGSTVLITGAARGIGRATAERLARAGARVVLGDRDAGLVAEVAAAIGPAAAAGPLDVTVRESWEELVAAHVPDGRIDVLVNNAGIMPLGSVLEEPDEVARAIVDVNLHGVVLGTKVVGSGMVARGRGHVVNIASAVGRIPVAGGATYSASKHAVVGFSEACRAELAPYGVDVSVVLPVIVRTELAAGVPSTRGVGSVGPQDVAGVVESAIRRPRPELWVPRYAQAMTRTTSVLPRRLQQALAHAFGADAVLSAVDPAARAAYEERARRG